MPISSSEIFATYDYLILAQFWMTGECCSQLNGCSVVCPFISIHGLWPTFNNGSWPEYCPNTPFNVSILPLNIDNYWYSSDGNNNSLYEHEWKKHGTCTSLSQDDYFSITLFIHEQLNININSDPTKLKSEYPRKVKLVCNTKCILEEIYSCWNKNLYPIECPDDKNIWAKNDQYTDCSECTWLNLCLEP